ncbi:MAG: RDD family protein [Gammaproteobacteria bacterium]|jgi:uncharacterized RDD family membrane protein YckC
MQNSVPDSEISLATAKRRLLSIVYDSLLLAAVLFIAFAIFLKFTQFAGIEASHSIKSVYLLSIIFFFYAGFWTHGGQTLGMKTWRIKLVHENGQGIRWQQALLRYLCALPSWFIILIGTSGLILKTLPFPEPFVWVNKIPMGIILGIGLVMLYIEQRPGNWRDRFSHTRVIMINPSSNAS